MVEMNAIVAGAGIWGCTVARRLAEAGRKVLVLEKRPVVGGNVRCEIDPETGIEIHTYGSHIFHTHIPEVWEFVNRFISFNGYQHKVLARTRACGSRSLESKSKSGVDPVSFYVYHLPIGKTLLEEFFGVDMRDKNLQEFLSQPSKPTQNVTSNWYDVVSPSVVSDLAAIYISKSNSKLNDRRAVKDVFKAFGLVENAFDGRKVTFPSKSVGKMLGQRGIDLYGLAGSFAELFRASRRAWSETEATLANHKEHRNIAAYHQYVARFNDGAEECYIRFTVREERASMNARNEVHSSTVSRITVYKAKGAELSSLGHAQAEDSTPFVDNKIAQFFAHVNGVSDGLSSGSGKGAQPSHRTNGEALFDAFIRGYTSKQWGVPPEKVDPSIIARLKVRDNYSTDYFDDAHQGIPVEGYNELFRKMLDHPNISVETEMTVKMVGADLRAARNPDSTQPPLEIDCGRLGQPTLPVYYSGPIDALFGYKFGALPWRTLRFEQETLDMPDYQGTSVVNYPDIDVPYTRIHEFKHYHPELVRGEKGEMVRGWGFDSPKTVVMREYSATWQPGDEPYYPVNTPESQELLKRYQEEVEKFNRHCSPSPSTFTSLTIGGRLGQYKYFDMDKSIEAALAVEI